MNDELVFTPAALIDLLTQLDELKDKNIQLTELNGGVKLTIGDSVYQLNTESAAEIEVPSDVVEEVADINDTTYEELSDLGEIDISEPIESGVLRSAIKSLLLGGIIRLVPDLMK